MRHFRATYTQYCIKHGLEPIQSRDEIIRFLIDKYNVRSTRETVWRIRGVRWRMKDEPVPVAPASTEAEESSLWRFMNAKVVVTKDRRNHWLDMKNNRLPNGDLQVGIRQRYFQWCEEKGEAPVDTLEMDPLSTESELMLSKMRVNDFRNVQIAEQHSYVFIRSQLFIAMVCNGLSSCHIDA
eukprot:g29706.t1